MNNTIIKERRVSEYERRSALILKGWERTAERRKAAEALLPKTTAEERGHKAYMDYKNNVDILRAEGII